VVCVTNPISRRFIAAYIELFEDFRPLTDSISSNKNPETPTVCDVDLAHERPNMVVVIFSGHRAF
jgi:hypothetical protein